MARNFRFTRIHCAPQPGALNSSLRTRLYSSLEAVPGFRRRSCGNLVDYVYDVPANPVTLEDITVDDNTTKSTVSINTACGGLVDKFTHALSDDSESIQWIQRHGRTGRQLQVAWFPTDALGTCNPTQGGSTFGGTPVDDGYEQADAYSDEDVVQGSPMLPMRVLENADGSKRVSVEAIPLDFAINSAYPLILAHGKSAHDAIAFTDHRLGFDLTLHHRGLAGVHRWDGYLRFLEKIGPDLTGAHHHMVCHMRHGFDKLYVWNARNTSGIRLDNLEIVATLDAVNIASIAHSEGSVEVTITLNATHGRAVATQHNVTIANVTGTDAALVNGTHFATFVSATDFTITLASAITTEDLSGGDVSSIPILYHNKASTAARQMWVGQTNIGSGGGSNDIDLGAYPGESAFDQEGWHAVIFRADGTEAWSMADEFGGDFCVAYYGYVTGYIDGDRRIQLATWRNHIEGVTIPTNGEDDECTQIFLWEDAWLSGATGLSHEPGERRYTSYILVGAWDDVLAKLAILDALVASGSEVVNVNVPPVQEE